MTAFLSQDLNGQPVNRIIKDPATGEDILYGKVTTDAFREPPFAEWYETAYNSYVPDKEITGVLDPNILSTWFVTVVMGTWCPDSQRELPVFFKIWDELGLDPGTVTIIGVDTEKKAPNDMTDTLSIEKVPTFIFYQCNMELGRVVESPEESMEKELFRVLYEFPDRASSRVIPPPFSNSTACSVS